VDTKEEMERRNAVERKASGYLASRISMLVAFKPIYGTVFLFLNKTATWSMPTMGVGPIRKTDLALYYNPDFVLSLSDTEIDAVLIHEALHVLLHHIERGTHYGYHPRLYNVAADMAINTFISGLPPYCVLPKQIGENNEQASDYYYGVLKKKKEQNSQGGQKSKKQKKGSSEDNQGSQSSQSGQAKKQKPQSGLAAASVQSRIHSGPSDGRGHR
jgi:predicted metal-dependent peptidase